MIKKILISVIALFICLSAFAQEEPVKTDSSYITWSIPDKSDTAVPIPAKNWVVLTDSMLTATSYININPTPYTWSGGLTMRRKADSLWTQKYSDTIEVQYVVLVNASRTLEIFDCRYLVHKYTRLHSRYEDYIWPAKSKNHKWIIGPSVSGCHRPSDLIIFYVTKDGDTQYVSIDFHAINKKYYGK